MLKKINLLLIGLGLMVIVYFIHDYGLNKIIENIQLSGIYLLYVLLLWVGIFLLNTIVYKIIIGNKHGTDYIELLGLTISGFAINTVTPFVSLGGEPYKILALKSKLGTRRATSTTLLYTMIHMLAHTFFWLIGFAIAFTFFTYSSFEMFILILLLLFVFLLIWFFFSRHQKGVMKSLAELMAKLKFLKSINKKLSDNKEKLIEIDDQIKDFYHNRKLKFWSALSIELVARILTSLEIYIILISVNVNITIGEAVYLTAAFSLIMNLVFFVPMELGTRESSLYLLVQGISGIAGVGVYVAIISRIREVFWLVIGLVLIQIKGIKYKLSGNG